MRQKASYMRTFPLLSAALILALTTSVAIADDWVADRLRGEVSVMSGGNWLQLQRGEVVPDGVSVRTGADGRVELLRGAERIELASNTEISIRDAGSQKMTSVLQTYGSVTIEAERRNVQHFSVQTPVLAAVVKGTQFTVSYRNGQARVDVERGLVQVQDAGHDMVVDVAPGQWAEARQSEPLDIGGPGSEKAVFLIEGEVVPAAARDAVLDGDLAARDAVAAVVEGTLEQRGNSGNRNGNGNSRRDDTAAQANSNSGNGNGNGNSGNHGNGSAGGNSKSNSGNGGGYGNLGNGNGNSGSGNSGGNGNGNSGHSSANSSNESAAPASPSSNGNSNGPPEHSNAGGNGNGNGNGKDKK
jgi:hypothetical protein